jgi:hypothetical protein
VGSAGDRPALTATPAPTSPGAQVAGVTIVATPESSPAALPRTGSGSRPVARAGLALMMAGLALVAGGRWRRRKATTA